MLTLFHAFHSPPLLQVNRIAFRRQAGEGNGKIENAVSLPDEPSRENAVCGRSLRIDRTSPVKTAFGPTSRNIRTPASCMLIISLLKSTGAGAHPAGAGPLPGNQGRGALSYLRIPESRPDEQIVLPEPTSCAEGAQLTEIVSGGGIRPTLKRDRIFIIRQADRFDSRLRHSV